MVCLYLSYLHDKKITQFARVFHRGLYRISRFVSLFSGAETELKGSFAEERERERVIEVYILLTITLSTLSTYKL